MRCDDPISAEPRGTVTGLPDEAAIAEFCAGKFPYLFSAPFVALRWPHGVDPERGTAPADSGTCSTVRWDPSGLGVGERAPRSLWARRAMHLDLFFRPARGAVAVTVCVAGLPARCALAENA